MDIRRTISSSLPQSVPMLTTFLIIHSDEHKTTTATNLLLTEMPTYVEGICQNHMMLMP